MKQNKIIESTDIIKELKTITSIGGYSIWNIFEDWLDLMLFALMRNDSEYLKIVGKYKNDKEFGNREIDYFCKAFAYLMICMRQTNEDVLGAVYELLELQNKHNGQFFTPYPICDMMVKMTDVKKSENVNDPCCGSGRMLLAYLKNITNKQADDTVFVGQDNDYTCVKMCALNFVFFNMNGYIIWGDTFAVETRKVFKTTRSYCGGSIIEIDTSEYKKEKPKLIKSNQSITHKREMFKAFKNKK